MNVHCRGTVCLVKCSVCQAIVGPLPTVEAARLLELRFHKPLRRYIKLANHIHIFGASGSGVTTLGLAMSEQVNGKFLDTDTYYWKDSDPPYQYKNKPEDRVAMIERDIFDVDNWVLSGSLCSWGQPLLQRFSLAVFLYLPNALRMARILHREQGRFGARIEPDGDMHAKHVKFMDWASSYDEAKAPTRSLDMHEAWMTQLPCPVVRLDSSAQVDDLCDSILHE